MFEISEHLQHIRLLGSPRLRYLFTQNALFQIISVQDGQVCYVLFFAKFSMLGNIIEPVHGISNNVECATSKASDQPAHMRSLIRTFASRLSIL